MIEILYILKHPFRMSPYGLMATEEHTLRSVTCLVVSTINLEGLASFRYIVHLLMFLSFSVVHAFTIVYHLQRKGVELIPHRSYLEFSCQLA